MQKIGIKHKLLVNEKALNNDCFFEVANMRKNRINKDFSGTLWYTVDAWKSGGRPETLAP